MSKHLRILLAVLLALFLLPGCAALQALNQIKEPATVSSSPVKPDPTPSSSGGQTPSPELPKEPEGSLADPLDFADEAALRAVLEGEWVYCPPASDTPAAWITFSRDGSFLMKVKDPTDGTTWEDTGLCLLERWSAGADEAPDMLILTLTELAANGPANRPESGAGDYLIREKTLCDGEVVLALMQLNNGDSTFSLCFNDTSPILKKYTGWQPQGKPRKAEHFCGAVWKVDYTTQTIWLDDTGEGGFDNIGRYEALPYQAAPQLDLRAQPDWLLTGGTIWTVQTDAMGRIEEMQPYIYGYDDEYGGASGEPLPEEEAAELLVQVYEVQEYLDQGMVMLFDGAIEIIDGEPCVVIALGTDHEASFVRELSYAVAPSGMIYAYDPFTDSWNIAGMG